MPSPLMAQVWSELALRENFVQGFAESFVQTYSETPRRMRPVEVVCSNKCAK